MRICFLANELSFKDGWGRYSISLLKEITKKNKDCFVLLSKDSQKNLLPKIKKYKILPPLFAKRTKKIFSLLKNYKKIKKLIESADVVHSLIEPYSPIAYLVSKKKPFFVTLHGTYAVYPFRKFYSKLIYKKTYQMAKKLICVSHFTQKKVLEEISLKNTVVINNGVDYSKFQRKKIERKKGSNKKTILGVGILIFRKGYHISILAIVKVKEKYPNLKYIIVGNQKNTSYLKYLKNLAKKYQIENNIIFLEGLSEKELIEKYYQSDLFLLTPTNVKEGKFEGFGQVYLEAGACGIPVVGTKNCGAEDAIKDNSTGFLAEQDNVYDITNKILKILDDKKLTKKMSQNGRKQAKKMDWQKIAKKYLNIYYE